MEAVNSFGTMTVLFCRNRRMQLQIFSYYLSCNIIHSTSWRFWEKNYLETNCSVGSGQGATQFNKASISKQPEIGQEPLDIRVEGSHSYLAIFGVPIFFLL